MELPSHFEPGDEGWKEDGEERCGKRCGQGN